MVEINAKPARLDTMEKTARKFAPIHAWIMGTVPMRFNPEGA